MPTGTHSRSPSPKRNRSRSRSRSRSYDSYDSYTDDYSDSVYSDDDRSRGRTAKDKAATSKAKTFITSTTAKSTRTSGKKPPVGKTTTSKGKSPPKKPGAGRGKAVSKEQDYVARRVMSARRLKINDLRNENEDMKQQLADLMRENKLLARTATLQDRKLHQYEDQEGEMPRIISKHNEELRTAKEQIRRQKEKLSKSDGRLKESEDELDRTKRLLKKMKGLVDDKQLDERDNLSRKLSSVEADLEEKDHRVKNLERHVENLQKNHKHELGIERARYKELQKEVQGLRDTSSQLSADLKDARRDLDVQNIYANRARGGRSSTRNSTLSSPAPSQKGLAHHRKNSDPPGMTPREKAKQMELQRRLQDKKLRELPSRSKIQQKPYPSSTGPASSSSPQTFNRHTKHSSHQPDTIHEHTASGATTTTQPSTFMTEGDHNSSSNSVDPRYSQPHDRSYVKAPDYNERKSEVTRQSWRGHENNAKNNTSASVAASQRDSYAVSDAGGSNHYTSGGGGTTPGRGGGGGGGNKPSWLQAGGDGPKGSSRGMQAGRTSKGGRNNFYSSMERQGRVLAEESYHPEPPQEPSRRGQPQTLDDKPGNDWWEQMQKQKQHDENGYRREPKREAPVEEPEEEDWRQSRERLKHEADQRAREQREMREREERDEQERIEQQRRRQREEQERGEREERERRERERREREDRERREREDVARRAQEERDRLENDERERERNRQKNSLLAKMAALEKKKEDNSLISDPFAPQQKPVKKVDEVFDDPFAVPTSRKETKRSDKIQPSPTRRRGSGANYSFGKPIENLHNGKPAYEDVSVPVLERNKRRNNGIFDDDDFSYQPSFGSANRNSAGKGKVGGGGLSNADKAKQKDSLMSDLFGSSAAKSPPTNKFSGDDDDIFGTNNKKNSSSNRRNTNNNDLDFFGSSDPPPKNNSHLLPRRGRQPTTTFTSPAINAVDNFDDDIEEVVL